MSERLVPFVDHPRIALHGLVRSLERYYAAATVIACPLSTGGGVKVKILEALVRGCATVTTDIGRQGLKDAPLVIANSSYAFAREVVRLISDRDARNQLKQQASDFARTLPTWDAAAQRLDECWQQVIHTGSTHQ